MLHKQSNIFAKPIFGRIIIGSVYETSNILFVFESWCLLHLYFFKKFITVNQNHKTNEIYNFALATCSQFSSTLSYLKKKFKTFKLFSFLPHDDLVHHRLKMYIRQTFYSAPKDSEKFSTDRI